MDEHSDLDEQRPQWAWTKVSGAPNRGERNDRLLGRESSFHPGEAETRQPLAANRQRWRRLNLPP